MTSQNTDTATLAAVRAGLDESPHHRQLLFPYGFLITSSTARLQKSGFPFYDGWQHIRIGGLEFLVHPKQRLFWHESGGRVFFIIGHAYDPFAYEHDEQKLLAELASAFVLDDTEYTSRLNQLTGIFVTGHILDGRLTLVNDATGMQTVFYGFHRAEAYVASHAALVGYLCGLTVSDYVRHLSSYRFYHLFGKSLPGDLSPYNELARLIPNHSLSLTPNGFQIARFFPCTMDGAEINVGTYREIIDRSAHILERSMNLIASKWETPAISLTGGCDSQTTLACASGNYSDFRYFSYISSPEEAVDANAAKTISEKLGLAHETLDVAVEQQKARDDFELVRAILDTNYGFIGRMQDQEVAKRITLLESDIEVEVKSWVSEVARAYYHKRFCRASTPPAPQRTSSDYAVQSFRG